MIPVKYDTQKKGLVHESELDLLIETRRIVAFKRGNGWAVIGEDAVRSSKNSAKALVPVCCFCKKIRQDDGGWQTLEGFIKSNLAMDVTHGICTACMKKQYGID